MSVVYFKSTITGMYWIAIAHYEWSSNECDKSVWIVPGTITE